MTIHNETRDGSPDSREGANDALTGCEILEPAPYFFHNTSELMALQGPKREYLQFKIKREFCSITMIWPKVIF